MPLISIEIPQALYDLIEQQATVQFRTPIGQMQYLLHKLAVDEQEAMTSRQADVLKPIANVPPAEPLYDTARNGYGSRSSRDQIKKENDLIVKLWNEGKSGSQIAARLQLAQTTVQNRIARMRDEYGDDYLPRRQVKEKPKRKVPQSVIDEREAARKKKLDEEWQAAKEALDNDKQKNAKKSPAAQKRKATAAKRKSSRKAASKKA